MSLEIRFRTCLVSWLNSNISLCVSLSLGTKNSLNENTLIFKADLFKRAISKELGVYTLALRKNIGLSLISNCIKDVLGNDIVTEEVESAIKEGYYYLAHVFIDKEEKMKVKNEESVGGWRGWR